MVKKSYNPFKMWGSYIGLFMGIVIGYTSWGWMNTFYTYFPKDNIGILCNHQVETSCLLTYGNLYGMILYGILGFFISWGITSAIRAGK